MPSLNLRLADDLHAAARIAAAACGKSLQVLIADAIREKILRLGATNPVVAAAITHELDHAGDVSRKAGPSNTVTMRPRVQ